MYKNDSYRLWSEGWMARRQSPGNLSPLIWGELFGFAGSTGAKPAGMTNLDIKIKIGSDAIQTKTLGIDAIPLEGWDVPSAVTALTDLGFTGIIWENNTSIGRLGIKPSAGNEDKIIQIYGDIAAFLQFGNCRFGKGKGCYFYGSDSRGNTTDSKSAVGTNTYDEDVNIDNANGRGDLVRLTIPARQNGGQLVITDRRDSVEFRQMVSGGRYTPATASMPEIYDPPDANDFDTMALDVHVFTPIFTKKRNISGDETYIEEAVYIGCQGRYETTEANGSWTDSICTMTFQTYNTPDDPLTERNSPRRMKYTISQWEAANISTVLVRDWDTEVTSVESFVF